VCVCVCVCVCVSVSVYIYLGKRRRMRVTRITRKSFAFGTFVVVMNSDICVVKDGGKVGGSRCTSWNYTVPHTLLYHRLYFPTQALPQYTRTTLLLYAHTTLLLYYTHSISLHTLYFPTHTTLYYIHSTYTPLYYTHSISLHTLYLYCTLLPNLYFITLSYTPAEPRR
jgi:hypothetical protein